MATVRINQSMLNDVLYKVSNIYKAKIQKLAIAIEQVDVVQPLLNAVVTPEEQKAAEFLGEKWVNTSRAAFVNIVAEDKSTYSWYTNYIRRVTPVGFSSGVPPNVLVPGMIGYDEVYELVNEIRSLEVEREQIRKSIHNLFREATTLNKIVEVWPGIKEYLDQYTLQQLAAPAVKLTRKRAPLKLDDNAKLALTTLQLTKHAK